ncbi:MAG: ATP-binding protein [Deltaproteobacteria bacterium]
MTVLKGPEFYISKRVGRAIIDHRMIEEGDKILVAVSGGKDSLTLLRVLQDRQKFVPIKYRLLAYHVDMGYPRSISRILERYLKKQGVEYRIEKSDALKKTKKKDISCFWCSWNRRKALFEAAARYKCTKVALGHHLDDIDETILLNLFFQGEISSMKPRQELFEGKIVIIRPLCYTEEDLIRRFSRTLGFPHHTCDCPHSDISRRQLMTGIIKQVNRVCPEVRTNIYRSVSRIKKDYLP